jgi:hypothetical protein
MLVAHTYMQHTVPVDSLTEGCLKDTTEYGSHDPHRAAVAL